MHIVISLTTYSWRPAGQSADTINMYGDKAPAPIRGDWTGKLAWPAWQLICTDSVAYTLCCILCSPHCGLHLAPTLCNRDCGLQFRLWSPESGLQNQESRLWTPKPGLDLKWTLRIMDHDGPAPGPWTPRHGVHVMEPDALPWVQQWAPHSREAWLLDHGNPQWIIPGLDVPEDLELRLQARPDRHGPSRLDSVQTKTETCAMPTATRIAHYPAASPATESCTMRITIVSQDCLWQFQGGTPTLNE